jgi:hypothetical protein
VGDRACPRPPVCIPARCDAVGHEQDEQAADAAVRIFGTSPVSNPHQRRYEAGLGGARRTPDTAVSLCFIAPGCEFPRGRCGSCGSDCWCLCSIRKLLNAPLKGEAMARWYPPELRHNVHGYQVGHEACSHAPAHTCRGEVAGRAVRQRAYPARQCARMRASVRIMAPAHVVQRACAAESAERVPRAVSFFYFCTGPHRILSGCDAKLSWLDCGNVA